MSRWRAAVRAEAPWVIITLFWILALGLYLAHLLTGFMPGRVLLTIRPFRLDLYWYGFIIMSGVALGAWVVSRLARERAQVVFTASVPETLRGQAISSLVPDNDESAELPESVRAALRKRGVTEWGALLWIWGMQPGELGLKRAEREQLEAWMSNQPVLERRWWTDPPWRVWNPEHVWSGVIWCLVFAIIGARLYHVLTPSPSMAAVGINSPLDYFRNPMQLINLRGGGLGIYGGIVGGVIGLVLYTRRQHLPGLAWSDLAAIGVALGQVVGRWGNFFNQELYGKPTELPWAVTIEPRYRLSAYAETAAFHPAFLYESLWNFLAFLVLYGLYRRRPRLLRTGDMTALYLIFYAVGRILLELVRLDSRMLEIGSWQSGLPVASAVSIVTIAIALLWRGASRMQRRASA